VLTSPPSLSFPVHTHHYLGNECDSATTHSDLLLRARELGVETKNIYNASIFTAVGASGLQLYRFGQTISQVFWSDTWQPDSYYDKLKMNREQGFHTLCLLDIKVKEQSELNLLRGRKIYEPPRFMTCAEAAAQWLEIESGRKEQGA
jgi:diphthine methyl ester synthase